jgi:hypothetical protein
LIWIAKTEFSSLFIDKTKELDEFLPDFKFILYDLNSWSDNEIKGSVFTKAVLLLFKHIFSPDLQDKLPDVFSLFKDLSESQTGLQYLESLIRYLLSNTDDLEINDLKSIVSNAVDQNKGDMVMTIAERLRQEGRLEGKQEGRLEGRQEGRQEAMQQGIGLVLAVFDKFGQSTETKIVVSMIKNIYEDDVLTKLEKKLNETNSIEDFKEAVFLES